MEKLYIVCVDDQRDVLHNVTRDLRVFGEWTVVEECESADEARALLEELAADGHPVALVVCDHIMPGTNGVDFLTELEAEHALPHLKKVLLTGQATHKDAIDAINRARIDFYLEKPWQSAMLQEVCRRLLTEFLFETGRYGDDFRSVADPQVVLGRLRERD